MKALDELAKVHPFIAGETFGNLRNEFIGVIYSL